VRDRPEEASGKAMGPDFIGTYKAQSPGKLAQHNETLDSGDRVNRLGQPPRRLSENEIFFQRSRKVKIITTGIHCSISRIIF